MANKSVTVDAVVVGAGPAGSAAALELAKAGRDVVIVERGPFPGAKNVYGGVVYGRILDEIIPQWWTWPRLSGSWAAAPAWFQPTLTARP